MRRVGSGGFGIVYEATDTELGGRVALKALQSLTPDSLYALKQEFRSLADVSHPNLVALYELAEHEGHWFFTMEFLDGTDFLSHVRPSTNAATLADALATVDVQEAANNRPSARAYPSSRSARKLDCDRLRRALPQFVEGVAGLHQLGMLHRDIKPSNVMVTREGRVVLLDFGLVRPALSGESTSGRITLEAPTTASATAIVGTPEYMSPEQSLGDSLGPASDWYSVGTVLYESLCGRRPFVGSIAEIVADRQYSDPPRPSQFAPDVPRDLEDLALALLRRNPAQRPTASQIARLVGAQETPSLGSALTGSEILVGREETLGALRGALSDVAPSRPVIVEVYGASGVGKSTLVGRFLDEARRTRGALVLPGRCDERKSVPFKAMDGVMDALSVYLRERPPEELSVLIPKGMESLGQLFPVLAFESITRGLSVRPEAPAASQSGAAQERRETGFAALKELLVRLSALRPVLIAVDDLQWGDDDSAALLREVLTGLDAPAVLFVATLRGAPGQVRTPFEQIESASLERRILDVSPLRERDALSLARALLRRGGADLEHEADRIAREAEGNPFFLGELARYAAEHPDRGPLERATLRDVVLARVKALPQSAQELLELVAVIGQPVPQRVIFDASGLGADAYPALRVLRAANMVRIAGAKEADSVEPYHDRVRESVVGALSPETLRGRHASIAKALEARADSDPGLLAEHLAGAGERERAATAALRAAVHADRAFAFERAARWYEAAIAWGRPGATERAELLGRMAHALASCGRNGAAAEAFLDAASLAKDRSEAIDLRRHAGVQFFIEGRHDDGVRTLAEVAKKLDVSIPGGPLTMGVSLAADAAWLRVRGVTFRERPAASIERETLQRLDLYHYAGLGTAFANSLLSMWFLTRFTRAALEVGEPVRVGLALLRYSTTLSVVGPSYEQRALEVLRKAEDLSIRHRDPYLRGCIDMGYGFLDLMTGRWAQAIARCERACDQLTRVPGAVWDADTAASFITEGLTNQGRLALAFRKAQRQERDARERNFMAGMIRNQLRWESLRRIMNDDIPGARQLIADASLRIPNTGFLFGHYLEILGRANVALYSGEPDATLAWLRGRWPALERSLMLSAQVFRYSANSALAALLLETARTKGARERATLLTEADAIGRKLEAEDGTHVRARGIAVRAAAAAIGGDDTRALTLYRGAVQGFETADMQLHAAGARLAVGALIGGDEGALLVDTGTRAFTEQGVRSARPFAAICVTQPSR